MGDKSSAMGDKSSHIAMYPWFAMGHLTPYMHLANKLAERGHRVSFLLPTKTIARFESLNLYPSLVSFIPITVPEVDGLLPGAETTSDIPYQLNPLLVIAIDLTKPVIESHLQRLKPQFIFFDSAYWLPAIARELGIKSVYYSIISPCTISCSRRPEELVSSEVIMMEPPLGFPENSSIKLCAREARDSAAMLMREYGRGISFAERLYLSLTECDAIGFKACKEMEGPYCDYVEKKFGRPVILAGPVIPKLPSSLLEQRIALILDRFEDGSLVFVCFGSECVLAKDQFQELVLGLELTGLPFLAALKQPFGFESIESALPEGFQERVQGKGFVLGGWVQQFHILNHPSVGCFVTHCGSGSLSEGLVSKCQLVLLPNRGDQIVNARFMGGDLKVGVEIEKGEEDGRFTRDGVCKVVKSVMDGNSEVGIEVRKNHKNWREFLLSEGLESYYIDSFIHNLLALGLGL